MNYQQLPLVNVYPISESAPSAMQIALAEHTGEVLRTPEVANTPLEFAEITARKFFVNGLQMCLEYNLRNSSAYKDCKSAMPPLYSVPNLKKYRVEYPHYDLSGVDFEIRRIGLLPKPGQVVFHGGVWPVNSGVCRAGQKFTLTKPFSTTLCAGVAGAHANTHNPRQLWVITVSPMISTPIFLFSNNRNQFLSHELEVLFASGAVIECTAERQRKHYQIIEVSIV
ncbi:hypothetical protein [Franzmannia qiaohouensis]|uniref:Uncharacterized protein n=1 Tax=Franzmannia qiaohouensis TaxID=1329370 RepID=A0ABU1HDW7_9GAMM|nr:hypothetical protein [Halomonas qiaohouensis]MDR5905660.1 hypothetical protein [Halomonas qiaohouensis]